MKEYEKFLNYVLGADAVALDSSFRQICRHLRVSGLSVEECLFEELGMSGEELLKLYRNCI